MNTKPNIAFFDAKPYDIISFDEVNKSYNYNIKYIKSRLSMDTTVMATGYEVVCAFVNDDISQPVIDELYKKMLGDPEDVPPIVVYLASNEAANINGQIFGASGGQISIYAPWTEAKTITKEGRWTMEELCETIPRTLAEGLASPASPQSQKE